MKFKKVICMMILPILVLGIVSCNKSTHIESNVADAESEEKVKPRALVLDIAYSDSPGESSLEFSLETDFRFSKYTSYTDEEAVQQRIYRDGQSEKNLVYKRTKINPYADSICDKYSSQEDEQHSVEYDLSRDTDKVTFIYNHIPMMEKVGEIFKSDNDKVNLARKYLSLYISESLSEYAVSFETSTTQTADGYYTRNSVLFELRRGGILLSRVRVSMYGSGALQSIDLREYYENASAVQIPENLGVLCDTLVEERIEENRQSRLSTGKTVSYQSYDIREGKLYRDHMGRDYVWIMVEFKYERHAEFVDFVIFLD